MSDDDTHMELSASVGRRAIGVGSVAALGAIMVYLSIVQSPGAGWQFFMIVFAA
jgi:hypothetical protein